MILSASRRTDIPAFYADWFIDKIKQGFVLVPDPLGLREKVARIKIEPVRVETNLLGGKTVTGNVDGIVFWTKNPRPLMDKLGELKDFKYYFLYTLNPYNETIEATVPPIQERIKTFQELSKTIGADYVIWRYDPILLTSTITPNWHFGQFETLARQLRGFTRVCKVSFLIGGDKNLRTPNTNEKHEILKRFAEIAHENEIELHACAEEIDFSKYGIKQSKCIDADLFEKLTGGKINTRQSGATRKHCGCMPCVDIGVYNTCKHGCVYCYANGFYAPRKQGKGGEIYDRKTERVFKY